MVVKVQKEDFDLGTETKNLIGQRTDIGAIVTFSGLVRDHAANSNIVGMELEHYPGMTQKQLQEIENEARSRWDLNDCLIIHRFGKLNPGENIVLVITASAHREDAFLSAQFLMDFLKTKAPFWKRETTRDGKQWVRAKASDDIAADRWVELDI